MKNHLSVLEYKKNITTSILHYFNTSTPIFNLLIDAVMVIFLLIFWVYFIIWIDTRDIDGNPLYYYDSIHDWKKWYYKSVKHKREL